MFPGLVCSVKRMHSQWEILRTPYRRGLFTSKTENICILCSHLKIEASHYMGPVLASRSKKNKNERIHWIKSYNVKCFCNAFVRLIWKKKPLYVVRNVTAIHRMGERGSPVGALEINMGFRCFDVLKVRFSTQSLHLLDKCGSDCGLHIIVHLELIQLKKSHFKVYNKTPSV